MRPFLCVVTAFSTFCLRHTCIQKGHRPFSMTTFVSTNSFSELGTCTDISVTELLPLCAKSILYCLSKAYVYTEGRLTLRRFCMNTLTNGNPFRTAAGCGHVHGHMRDGLRCHGPLRAQSRNATTSLRNLRLHEGLLDLRPVRRSGRGNRKGCWLCAPPGEFTPVNPETQRPKVQRVSDTSV
jgi:hypothetical protein